MSSESLFAPLRSACNRLRDLVPVYRDKLLIKGRYDLYRPSATWLHAKTNYEIGLNFRFCKYFEIQSEYVFTNDRSLAHHNYSSVYVQVSVRY